MNTGVRIAMWSGPRNISTAMMRSFGARPDTTVVDEPFYAAYLAKTGIVHPMRQEVLASQSQDWRVVAEQLVGPIPHGKEIYYQKHMTHHMLDDIDLEWMDGCRNAFLIRDPADVLASYVQKRSEVTLEDIGIVRQRELFEREADRFGQAPPVIDGADILARPAATLRQLCDALGIEFTDSMLKWPSGRRDTDGVWAPAWYHAVEQSTGFAPPNLKQREALPPDLARIADAAQSHYELMARFRLRGEQR